MGITLYESRETIEQQAFLWVAEMALNDEIKWYLQYNSSAKLGGYGTVIAAFRNIIVEGDDPITSVRFESDQLGAVYFDRIIDNNYKKDIFIPIDPANYPEIIGNITTYEGISQKLEELGIQVVYVGSIISELLKDGWASLTF